MNPSDPAASDPKGAVSRRAVLGGAGLAAAAVAAPAFAQDAATAEGTAPAQTVMRDPVTQFPSPRSRCRPRSGRASPPSWTRAPTTARRATWARVGSWGGARSSPAATAASVWRPPSPTRARARRGHQLLACRGARRSRGDALIEAEGRTALALPGDVRDEAFCTKLVADAVSGLGGLDILVSNAARQQQRESILDITNEDLDATFKTNLCAMLWITKAALPHVGPGSAIIVTASEQAVDPSANLLDHAQTKAAQVAFTRSLAKHLAKGRIRVNAVAPGPFWTPLQPSGGARPLDIPGFGISTPMGRPGQPVELASTYVHLASQGSSYASGQVYGAQGGSGKT